MWPRSPLTTTCFQQRCEGGLHLPKELADRVNQFGASALSTPGVTMPAADPVPDGVQGETTPNESK